MAGDAVSPVYDIVLFRWAAFELPHKSVTPPGDTAAFLGDVRPRNAVFCALLMVALR